MKKIIVDYKVPWRYPKAGIAAYFDPLLQGLCRRFVDTEIVVVSPGELPDSYDFGENCHFRHLSSVDILSVWGDIKYSLYDFPRYLSRSDADLLISPYYDFMIPKCFAGRAIITIHDTCYFDLPFVYPHRTRYLQRFWLNHNLNRAAAVLTVSEFSRLRIMEHFPCLLRGKEPRVIYNSFVSPVSTPYNGNSAEDLRCRLAVPSNKRVVLYTGGFDVRKNLPRLFAGFKKVLDHSKAVLIVTGTSRDNPKLISLIRSFGLEGDVILTGFLPEEDMLSLYRTIADCAVSVSLCEGFGRSAVEAKMHGLPFVSTPLEVVREFVGDYPIYCDPYDVVDIHEKMVLALSLPRNDINLVLDERLSVNRNIAAFCSVIEGILPV